MQWLYLIFKIRNSKWIGCDVLAENKAENKVDRAKMMGEGDIKKTLMSLAIPAIVGMVISAVYNIVDTMFVGRLGTSAIGAATVVYPIFMLLGAFGLGIGVGAGTYISRLLGADNKEQANKTATVAIVTTAVVSLIVMTIALIFIEPILIFFGATPTIMPYAHGYAKIIVMGSLFTMSNMTLNNILRAEGSATISMVALIIGAGLNIILDPLFIFTLGMGINGAALATVLSQMVSTIFLLGVYFTGKSVLKISPKHFKPSKDMYSEIFKIGVPQFMAQVLISFSMAMFSIVASPYGDAAIAAMGVVNRVYTMCLYILFGFVQGFIPLAGYNYGAQKYDRVIEALKVAIKYATIFSIGTTIVYFVFADLWIKLFSSDPMVIAIGTKALRAFSITISFTGFLIVMQGLFQSMGRGKAAAILSLSKQGLFLIPTLIILPKIIGVNGILFSQPLADTLTLIVTIYFSKNVLAELREKADGMEAVEVEA